MSSEHSREVASGAKRLYAEQLQAKLEAEHHGSYVAIEPTSGDYFLADSYADAVARARAARPDQIAFVIRIGHDAAVHIGAMAD